MPEVQANLDANDEDSFLGSALEVAGVITAVTMGARALSKFKPKAIEKSAVKETQKLLGAGTPQKAIKPPNPKLLTEGNATPFEYFKGSPRDYDGVSTGWKPRNPDPVPSSAMEQAKQYREYANIL